MQYLYANQNVLKLGATLAAGGTTLTVVNGTAWPALSGAQRLQVTLLDAATGAITEIVTVTAHAAGSNTMTIVRAQEGTTAKAFAVGDYAVIMMTQAVWNNFTQPGSLTWYQWNNANVTPWVTFPNCTSGATELWVAIDRATNTVKIRGIIRQASIVNGTVLFALTTMRMDGTNTAISPYASISTSASTGAAGTAWNAFTYLQASVIGAGATSNISMSGAPATAAGWIMLNHDIIYN